MQVMCLLYCIINSYCLASLFLIKAWDMHMCAIDNESTGIQNLRRLIIANNIVAGYQDLGVIHMQLSKTMYASAVHNVH